MMEFGQPLALWTGLAIALPILAHLAYRRIAHKLPFSSLRFIRSSSIPRSGRRKPSDWPLLLLRILLFVLLTLLLADPYWQKGSLVSGESSEISECLFLLDSTPSMRGWGAWEAALNEIRSRLEKDPHGRFGFLVFQNGTLKEWPIGTSREELISALDTITPQESPAGLQAMIDRAPGLFLGGGSSKKIVLLSDFQKSSWQELAGDFGKEKIELELCAVGHGDTQWMQRSGNFAIVDARVAPGGLNKVRVWAALKNFDTDRSDLNISIIAGGDVRETTQLSVPPLGTEQIQFALPASDFAQATVRIDNEDAYSMDNNQSLWILPPLPRTFGFWNRLSLEETDLLEAQFLRAAMESAGDGAWNRWTENDERAKELRMGLEDGQPVDLLMVLGLSGWFQEEGLTVPLRRHLKRGGAVLVTPPEDSHVRMNQALKEPGLLDFTFAGFNRTAFRMEPYRIEVLPQESRLNKVFAGDSVRDLYLSQIRQFINVEEGDDLEIPLRDRSGRPLVLIRTFPNGGRLVLFTFRMLPQWTDLPMRNSFLPLLVELGSLDQREENNGGVLRVEAGDPMKGSHGQIDSQRLGLFQIGEQRVEVVHPLVESMPEVMSQHELKDALVGGHLPEFREGASIQPDNADTVQSLWQWFALSAAILLIVEMIVSAPPTVITKDREVVNG